MSYINEMAIQFHGKKEMDKFIENYTLKLNELEKDEDPSDTFTSYDNIFQYGTLEIIDNDGEPVVNFGTLSFYPEDPCNKGVELLFDMIYSKEYNIRLIRIGEEYHDIQVIEETKDFFKQPISLGINIYSDTRTYSL